MKIMDQATQLEEVVAGRDAEAATIRTVLICNNNNTLYLERVARNSCNN